MIYFGRKNPQCTGRQDVKPHVQEWIKKHSGIFLTPGAEETLFVAEILKITHFQALVSQSNILRGRPAADPFVIACAEVRSACVVTEEGFKPNAAKIPNVCKYFHISHTNLQGFMENEGWIF